jgi:hypothetical protein
LRHEAQAKIERVSLSRPDLSSWLCHQSAAMARNLLFFLRGDNLNLVSRESQGFKPVRGRRPYTVAVLSDPAGEYHNVYTAQQSRVCSDYLSH